MNDNVEEKIFETIKSGRVKMRPRWYFILRTVLAVLASVVLFSSIVFLGVFIALIQSQNGTADAIQFGLAGWYFFFRSLPWALIITAIVFVVLLGVLAHRYAFVYYRPFIYVFIAIVALAVIGSILISATPLYSAIFGSGEPQGYFINGIYRYEVQPASEVHRGQISYVANNGFILENASGTTSTVIFVPGISFDPSDFSVGEPVVVFGREGKYEVIQAFGVEKLK